MQPYERTEHAGSCTLALDRMKDLIDGKLHCQRIGRWNVLERWLLLHLVQNYVSKIMPPT